MRPKPYAHCLQITMAFFLGCILTSCTSSETANSPGWYEPVPGTKLSQIPNDLLSNPALGAVQVGSGQISGIWVIDRNQGTEIIDQLVSRHRTQIRNAKDFLANSEDPDKELHIQELDQALTTLATDGLVLQAAFFTDTITTSGFSALEGDQALSMTSQAIVTDAAADITNDGKQRDWHPAVGWIGIGDNGVTQAFRFNEQTLQKYRSSNYGWEYQADITVPTAYSERYNDKLGKALTVFEYGCFENMVGRTEVTRSIPDGFIHDIPSDAKIYVDSPVLDSIVNNPTSCPSSFTEKKHVQSVGIGIRYPGKLSAGTTYLSIIPGRWKKGGPGWGDDSSCAGASTSEHVITSSSVTVEARNPVCTCRLGYANCMFKAGCDDPLAKTCSATESSCPTNDPTNDEYRVLCYSMTDTAPGNPYGIKNLVTWHLNFCPLPHGDKWSGGPNIPCCEDTGCAMNQYCDLDTSVGGGYCKAGSRPLPSCNDMIKNGSETSKDCGGSSCPPCADNLACLVNTDCINGYCASNVCISSPQILVDNLTNPFDLTLDSSNIYWIEKNVTGGALRRVPKSGGSVVTLSPNLAEPTAVIVDASYAYVLERNGGSNGMIHRIPLTGGSPDLVVNGLNGAVNHLIQSGTNLYWGDYSMGGVIRTAPKGVNVTSSIVAQGNGMLNLQTVTAIDTDGTYLYVRNDSYQMLRFPISGGSPTILGSAGTTDFLDAIRVFGGSVYFISPRESRLGSISAGGGAMSTLALVGNAGPSDLAVDSSSVYFIDPAAPGGSVRRVGIGGGQLKTYYSGINSIGIEVDSSHVYWITYNTANQGKVMRAPK